MAKQLRIEGIKRRWLRRLAIVFMLPLAFFVLAVLSLFDGMVYGISAMISEMANCNEALWDAYYRIIVDVSYVWNKR